MADSQDNRPLAYNLSDKETEQAIEDYKKSVLSGDVTRPCIPHFCSVIGYTEKEVAEVFERGNRENANSYTRRAIMLTKFFAWVRGMMFQCDGWAGQMKGAALFLLAQDFGDGVAYKEPTKEDRKQAGKVVLQFGGSDKRASKAAK